MLQGAVLTGSLAVSQPGDAIEAFTILSAAANETVARAHGRMPVIVRQEACGPWLAGEEVPLAPLSSGPADRLSGQCARQQARQ